LSHAAPRSATITFDPDVADNFKKLRRITGLNLNELLNALIYSPLEQIIQDGDTGLLQKFIHPSRYGTKEEALAVIERYEAFIAELLAAGDNCFHDVAAPARTNDGQWRILFKCTHPDGDGKCEEAKYR
jgi:hypothetical protein